MSDIFILNEIWTQDKIYIMIGIFHGCNMKIRVYYFRKTCYLLVELHERFVYLRKYLRAPLWFMVELLI
jgi:hypothetical protein